MELLDEERILPIIEEFTTHPLLVYSVFIIESSVKGTSLVEIQALHTETNREYVVIEQIDKLLSDSYNSIYDVFDDIEGRLIK